MDGWRRCPAGAVASRGLVWLDVLGRVVTVSPAVAARLRDLAAAGAGRSLSQRDLSLVLERALRTGATVALQRGEARALLDLAGAEPADRELAAVADAVRKAL